MVPTFFLRRLPSVRKSSKTTLSMYSSSWEGRERGREERGREKEEGQFRGCRQATESGEPHSKVRSTLDAPPGGRLTVPWLVVLTLFQEGKYKIPQRPSAVTLWGKAQVLAYDAVWLRLAYSTVRLAQLREDSRNPVSQASQPNYLVDNRAQLGGKG